LRNLWMYGATDRNQGTNVKLKTEVMGGVGCSGANVAKAVW